MSRIEFRQDGKTWWFDPESGEYDYDGESALIKVILQNMEDYTDIQTENLYGADEHPGEVWRTLSPEERKAKVLNYITQFNGVKVNEPRQTENR